MNKLLGVIFLTLMSSISFAQVGDSPIGTWQTVDEEGQKKALVQISQDPNGNLRGRILKLQQKPGALCVKCEGDKKDKPIEGMSIMWGLKKAQENNKWEDGAILDPSNGKTYNLKAELIENGQKFKLRGFLGISLLGRTQIWTRVQ